MNLKVLTSGSLFLSRNKNGLTFGSESAESFWSQGYQCPLVIFFPKPPFTLFLMGTMLCPSECCFNIHRGVNVKK